MAFRVGQKVVRIGGNAWNACPYAIPPLGEPVTVASVFTVEDGRGTLHIEVLEYPVPDTDEHYAGFIAKYFRPVQSTDAGMSILEQIRRDVTDKILRPIFEDEQV